jgi:tripeptide aminopeptidase
MATIRILFTPDEEVGHGVDHVDIAKLGAFAVIPWMAKAPAIWKMKPFRPMVPGLPYNGVSSHPGFAKGKMESAIKIAGQILAALPDDLIARAYREDAGFCTSGR